MRAGSPGERGETVLEYLALLAFFILPLFVVIPLILDILFRHYAMISYVLTQPGP